MQKIVSLSVFVFIGMNAIFSLVISDNVLAAEHFYGPIQVGERLWNIATQIHPDRTASRYQVMLAVLKANPQAFKVPCNLNTLKVNKTLKIPSLLEMQALSKAAAIEEFNRQKEQWQTARKRRQQIVCPPPATELNSEPSIISLMNSIFTPTMTDEIVDVPMKTDLNFPAMKTVTPALSPVSMENNPMISTTTAHLTTSSSWWKEVQSWFSFQLSQWDEELSWLSKQLLVPIGIILLVIFVLVFFIRKRKRQLFSYFNFNQTDKKQLSYNPVNPPSVTSTLETQPSPETVQPDQELAKSNPSLEEESLKSTETTTSSTDSKMRAKEMQEKLENVRTYLATNEEQFVQNMLRDVAQNGTTEQQVEAKQLYEISKKISVLKNHNNSSSQSDDSGNLWSDKPSQDKLLPNHHYLPEEKEKIFGLIDKIFEVLDYELNTQGKLIDAYFNRHKADFLAATDYQLVKKNDTRLVDKAEEKSFQTTRATPQPTRYL